MLQKMQKRVEADGEKEKELYEKFMCYCSSGTGDLQKSINDMEDKIAPLRSDFKAAQSKELQSREDQRKAQVDRENAEAALKEATAIRAKEHKAYVAYRDDADVNHKVLVEATRALDKGLDSSFLQTKEAQMIRQMVDKADDDTIVEEDRQAMISFLSGSTDNEYPPSSAGILGIMKQMVDSLAKGIHDAATEEDKAVAGHFALIKAKSREIKALTSTVEQKTVDIGELGVQIIQMKDDLKDTEKALAVDKKFAKELEKGCKGKTKEWGHRQRTRAAELVALADTIKALNDDDALDLFKKTLPGASASFLQVMVSSKAVRSRAMHFLHRAKPKTLKQDKAGLALLTLALAGKKSLTQGGLDKVVKMCDEMLTMLKEEQTNDDNKKEYCTEQLDVSEDKKKVLERTVTKEHRAIAANKDALATTIDEIESLTAGIKKLDRSVAEATDQRKKEHNEYEELMAEDTGARELLKYAKDRLNKVYNPKENPQEFAQVPSLVQVSMRRDAPGPPPETWDAYTKTSKESTGVISMVELLLTDLEKDIEEAETEEKAAQTEYETMMLESAQKRTTDSTSLTEKTTAKADLETAIEEGKANKFSAQKEAMATAKYISNLHGECDWLLQYYDARKEARAGEIDAVTKARSVLSGADYSLVQTKVRTFLHVGKKLIA